MKYQPKFAPEVYLRFLNGFSENGVTFQSILKGNKIFQYMEIGHAAPYKYIRGETIEECLDQAIIETRFESSEYKKNDWISILDNLPPDGERILFFAPFEKEKIFSGWFYEKLNRWCDGHHECGIQCVTHWKILDESDFPKCDSFEDILWKAGEIK